MRAGRSAGPASRRAPTEEWWAEIVHALLAHVREEAEFLEAYAQLAATVEDPGTRFLVELILEDERRHHDLMARMAGAALGDGWAGGVGLRPPAPGPEEAEALLGPTARFLDAEREDSGHLRELARQLRRARSETLWPLLVELMGLDTAKHVRILEYVHERLRRAAA